MATAIKNKVKLGVRPETFKPFPVTFQMPDGTTGVIEATFRYRTRKEFGKMLNEMFAAAGKEKPEVDADEAPKPVDFEALFAETGSKNAEHLLESLTAWDVDADLNKENVEEFCDTQPAGAAALMAAYSRACQEGRLGNS